MMYEKKEVIRISPMTKAPTQTEMSKGQSDNTNNPTKKFDYTADADVCDKSTLTYIIIAGNARSF